VPVEEHLLGDPDDIRRILEALDDRNNALDKHAEQMARNTKGVEALSRLLAENTAEVQRLRVQVVGRPTAEEFDYRRRRLVAGVLLFGVLMTISIDAHTEQCGAGTRAERLVDAVDRHAPAAEFLRLARPRSTPGCDLTSPLHTHGGRQWPTGWNWLGFGLYGAMMSAVGVWVHRARGRAARSRPHGEEAQT
jgi:hypothetical protein